MNPLVAAMESMHRVRHSSVLTTAATQEPVSIAEFKQHARIEGNFEDAKIGALLATARITLESDTRRSFVTQTRTIRLDYLPAYILLDWCPVQSVSSITYYDANNSLQTMSASLYEVDVYSEPAIIRASANATWPTTYDRLNAVAVEFVAGYGVASSVPQDAKHAIKLLAAHWYINGEAVGDTLTREVELSYGALRDRLRWCNYA